MDFLSLENESIITPREAVRASLSDWEGGFSNEKVGDDAIGL